MIEMRKFNEWTKAEILAQVKKEEYWSRLIYEEGKEIGVQVGSKMDDLRLLSENELRILFLITCYNGSYYINTEPFDFEEYAEEMRHYVGALDEGADPERIQVAFIRRRMKWSLRKILEDTAELTLLSDTEERIVWKYIYDAKYGTSNQNQRNFNWDEAIDKLKSEEGNNLYQAYMRIIEKRQQTRNEEGGEISQ